MAAFDDTPEQAALRDAVAALGAKYGHRYYVEKAKTGGHTTELWAEAGKLGYLGVSVPAEYGGGGGGITELAIVCEELAAAGCPLLLLVVSPAIVGHHHRQARHRRRSASSCLPGFADGTLKIVFAITEPEAGSNFHRLGTVARRDGDDWVLSGRKCFISGVDEAPYVLVVARTADSATGELVAGAVPGADRRGRPDQVEARHGDRVAGEPVAALPRRRTGAGRRADRRRATPACRRCSPGSTRSASRSPRWASAPAGTRWRGPPRTPRRGRSGAARSAPTRASRIRWRTRRSRSSWPG